MWSVATCVFSNPTCPPFDQREGLTLTLRGQKQLQAFIHYTSPKEIARNRPCLLLFFIGILDVEIASAAMRLNYVARQLCREIFLRFFDLNICVTVSLLASFLNNRTARICTIESHLSPLWPKGGTNFNAQRTKTASGFHYTSPKESARNRPCLLLFFIGILDVEIAPEMMQHRMSPKDTERTVLGVLGSGAVEIEAIGLCSSTFMSRKRPTKQTKKLVFRVSWFTCDAASKVRRTSATMQTVF